MYVGCDNGADNHYDDEEPPQQTINFLSAQYPQFGGRIPRLSGKALDCYLLATNTEKMKKVINFAAKDNACIKNNI